MFLKSAYGFWACVPVWRVCDVCMRVDVCVVEWRCACVCLQTRRFCEVPGGTTVEEFVEGWCSWWLVGYVRSAAQQAHREHMDGYARLFNA